MGRNYRYDPAGHKALCKTPDDLVPETAGYYLVRWIWRQPTDQGSGPSTDSTFNSPLVPKDNGLLRRFAMENKLPAQSIQDVYLNTMRRDKILVTIFLLGGVRLMGKIKGFDKYSVVLEANNQEQLIFKHAISTVTTARPVGSSAPQAPQA